MALLVDGVTKFDKAFYGEAAEAETIRKMIVAAGKDVRVLVIKLADRLHNMRTLDARSPASRARIARPPRTCWSRCATGSASRRSSASWTTWCSTTSSRRRTRASTTHVAQPPGLGRLPGRRHRARPAPRCAATRSTPRSRRGPRHYYSIWKDTVAGGHQIPLDLPRIAVIVDGPDTDCYAALGAIHGQWRPVAGRFKDFIASPKNNLYRSLHTTVIGPEGRLVEVLIRTEAMHRCAEYGVAASFRYPRTGKAGETAGTDQLTWLKRVLDWEPTPPTRRSSSRRCAATWPTAQITVFAEGASVELPAGATPVDLAYELSHAEGRPVPGRDHQRPAGAAVLAAERRRRGGDLHRDRRPRRGRVRVAPRGPRREWLGFVKSQPRAAADQPVVRRGRRAGHHASPTRCGWAGPRSG